MAWLYRGAFSSAANVGNKENLGYMGVPFKMLKLLLSYDIKPICIFDGRPHEGKIECEKKRSIDKAKNKELATKFEKDGNSLEARKYNTRALFVKSKQIDLLIEILDLMNI